MALVKNIFLRVRVVFRVVSLTYLQQRKSGSRIGLNVTRLLPGVTVFSILLGCCYSAALAQEWRFKPALRQTRMRLPTHPQPEPSSTSAPNELLLALIATDDVETRQIRVKQKRNRGRSYPTLVDRTNKESGTAGWQRAYRHLLHLRC